MAHLNDSVFDADKIMSRPLAHISQKRPEKFILAIWPSLNHWFDCPEDKRLKYTHIFYNLINCALLMDDILDDSAFRRGIPSAHIVYGSPQTLYGILYSTFDQFEKLLGFSEYKEPLADDFIASCLKGNKDVAMVRYYQDNFICPTFQEYYENLNNSAWLSFILTFSQLYGKNKLPNFERFRTIMMEKVATFAQIYNDYIDMKSSKYATMRSNFCGDVTEGKFSFPMIHAIQCHPEDDRILKILKERPTDIDEKKRFVKILDELGSLEFARKTMKKLIHEFNEGIDKLHLSRNPYIDFIFEKVLDNLETDDEIFS